MYHVTIMTTPITHSTPSPTLRHDAITTMPSPPRLHHRVIITTTSLSPPRHNQHRVIIVVIPLSSPRHNFS
jgi:hypothetical protein